MRKMQRFLFCLIGLLLCVGFAFAQTAASDTFTVYYFETDTAAGPSNQTTLITRGTATSLIRFQDLGYSEDGRKWLGWKMESDGKVYAKDASTGTAGWVALENGELPAGYEIAYKANGGTLQYPATKTATSVNLYGQWKKAGFTIFYHEDDNAEASDQNTEVVYGTPTAIIRYQDLGYKASDRVFTGWKVYREEDQSWNVINPNGSREWITLTGGQLPDGYEFALQGNGVSLSTLATGGMVHFYAQWKSSGFTVLYHENENSAASSTKTYVTFGTSTPTKTAQELGFGTDTNVFWGWRIQLPDGRWAIRKTDSEGIDWIAAEQVPEGRVYYVHQNGNPVSTLVKEGEVHFYAQWISTTIDVTDPVFGADGTDTKDDWESIQKALSVKKITDNPITVQIPAGKYHLGAQLSIYSNTKLVLDSGAVLIRDDDSVPMLMNGILDGVSGGGYNRSENITIQGGTWDGNPTGTKATDLIYLMHGTNINIIGATVTNCCGSHHIELAAVKNSSVKNCTLKNFIFLNGKDWKESINYDASGEYRPEAVQLDFAGEVASPGAAPFDGTGCSNVTISGCTFENCVNGAGNHHGEGTGNLITISGNTFRNMKNTCIDLFGYKNSVVKNNKATNAYRFMYVLNATGFTVTGNTVTHETESPIPTGKAIEILNSTGGDISGNNQFDGFVCAVHVSNAAADITGNTVKNMSGNGVTFSRSSGNVQDNTISNIGRTGIYVVGYTGDITGNTVTSCASYNIASYKDTEGGTASKGTIKGNQFDNPAGLFNNSEMTVGENSNNAQNVIFSAEAVYPAITKGTAQEFTVAASENLKVLMLYAENGTSLVTSWEADGNSTVSDNVRTWKVSTVISGAGDRSLVIKAGESGTKPVSNSMKVSFKVTKSGVLSAKSDVPTIVTGASAEFTVTTTSDIDKLTAYIENGDKLKEWDAAGFSTVSGSVRTWKVSTKINSKGNRTIDFRGSTAAGESASGRPASFVAESTGVISVEVQDAILAKGGTEKFNVVTTGDAKYLMLYAENGTSLVKKWAASGNSKADGDNLVWNVSLTISGTGERKLIFKAGTTTKPTASSQTAAFSVVAKKIVRATAGYDVIAKGAEQEFTVITTSDLQNLILYAENGASVVKKWTASGNSTVSNKMRTWKVKAAIGGTGDRKLVFRAGTTTATPVSNKVTVPFTVEANGVISAARTYATIAAGGTEAFTVKTTKDIKKLSAYIEKGDLLKSWDADKNSTVSGSVRTWKVSQKISSAGNRTFTFRGSTTAGETKSSRPVGFTVGDTGVISAEAKNSILAKGAEQTFTVTTTGNAKYLMIYAESGTSPVKKWAASGNSKKDGSNLVWTVKLAISGAGDRKMTFKAGKTTSPAAPARTTTFSVVDKKIVSAVTTYETIAKGSMQGFTVVTTATLKTLRLYAENGTSLVASWKADGNSTVSNGMRTWKVTAKIAGAGNRKLVFKAGTTDTKAVSNKVTVPFTVESSGVISAAGGSKTIESGTEMQFTVKTTKDITKLNAYTENGSLLKSWDAKNNSTVSGSIRTWKVKVKITKPGSRTFTFRGAMTADPTKSYRKVSFTAK